MDACQERSFWKSLTGRTDSLLAVPLNWKEPIKSKANREAPFLFETNADGYYGNFGSPLVNRENHLVALLTRGAADSHRYPYEYVDGPGGTITGIAYSGIREILEHIFDAGELLDELDGK